MNEDELSFDWIRVQKFRVGLGQPEKKFAEKLLTPEEAKKEELVVDDFVLKRLEENGFYSDAVGQGLRGKYTPFREGDRLCIRIGTVFRRGMLEYIADEFDDDNSIEVNFENEEICGTIDDLKKIKEHIESNIENISSNEHVTESYKILAKDIEKYEEII